MKTTRNAVCTPSIRKSLIGIAMFFALAQFAHAEVYSAPNGSAPPQTDDNLPNGAAPTAKQVQADNGTPPLVWNDTYVGYRYGRDFHYPGVPDKVAQNIGYLTTIGGFRYGSYAFNVDYLVSNSANPEAGGPSSGGAQEVYSVGRVELSAGKILGRSVGYGFVRDLGATVGYEFGVKNDAYAQRARMFVFGPTVEFAIPHGFWNLTIGGRTESNHNGIAGVDITFHTAWHIESSWIVPFRVAKVPLEFRGFASVTGPKGKDGFNTETTTEFLTRLSLLADVGSFIGHPRTAYLGVGYEYWHNMYGTPSSETVSTKTSAPMVMAELHF